VAALLELEGLSKSYGALKVIDDLDVHLDEGEALGVVGPNGAGKTTMLHLAGRRTWRRWRRWSWPSSRPRPTAWPAA
jgi:ABC-type branched-subunit amino acid transport system ATPase component